MLLQQVMLVFTDITQIKQWLVFYHNQANLLWLNKSFIYVDLS